MRPANSSPRLPRGRFDIATIVFHWTTLALILALLASGLSFATLEGTAIFAPALWLHRSLGVTVWTLTGLRLLWRMSLARFPAFPEHYGGVHRRLVQVNEFSLYALLFVQPATGFLASLLRGRPFALFGWLVPALLPRASGVSSFLLLLHRYGVCGIIVAAGGHALAALIHHYGTRDDILVAMAPWLRQRPRHKGLEASGKALARADSSAALSQYFRAFP